MGDNLVETVAIIATIKVYKIRQNFAKITIEHSNFDLNDITISGIETASAMQGELKATSLVFLDKV
ncbi:MAG: hypothetical protein EOO92_26010, partial [Pedobacter sp.]